MKRKAHLYEQMCDIELIKTAIRQASHGKRHHRNVAKILDNIDEYALKIKRMLEEGTFEPNPYVEGIVREGPRHKEREILKPKFYPDQVIHWCIYLVLKPWLFKRFYALSCGSIPQKGVQRGARFIEKWVVKDRKNTKYYLKMDITKFYQSIQPRLLIPKLRRIIKDEKFIELNERILYQAPGLPIGILLSQVYANYFVTDLDYYIKQTLNAKYYIRYMDDMVIFGRNKKELHKMQKEISELLSANGLRMKSNWQVCLFDKEPLDFLGFRFYRGHTDLRRSIMLAISRKAKKVYKAGNRVSFRSASGMISYLGWIKHSDSQHFYKDRIKPYIRVTKLKDVIRSYNNEKLQKQVNGSPTGVGHGVLSDKRIS